MTQAVVDSAGGRHPEGADLLHLGRMRLRGVSSPVDVWQVRHGDLRGTFPPLRTLDSIPHNLPRHATSFVGREIQIGEVIAHFDATNLLTLTGAGGCGKSRLALQVATSLLDIVSGRRMARRTGRARRSLVRAAHGRKRARYCGRGGGEPHRYARTPSRIAHATARARQRGALARCVCATGRPRAAALSRREAAREQP